MNAPSVWTQASTRRKRIYSIIAVFIVAFIITLIGTMAPMSSEQAEQVSKDLNQTVDALKAQGALVPYIFGNNFMICLIMFVPVVGPLFGLYVLFNTGSAISAIATTEGIPAILALVALFITPVAWLEFAAYSTGMAESVWLLRRLWQHKGKQEIRATGILVTIAAVLLLIGAVVETGLVTLV